MTLGSEISLSQPTPVGLVWHEFRGLNLDQWVLGNGQVSISDQFKDDFVSFQKRAHLNQDISHIPHSVIVIFCNYFPNL